MRLYKRGNIFWTEYNFQGKRKQYSLQTKHRTEAELKMALTKLQLEELRRKNNLLKQTIIEEYKRKNPTDPNPSYEKAEVLVEGYRRGKQHLSQSITRLLEGNIEHLNTIPPSTTRKRSNQILMLSTLIDYWLEYAQTKKTIKHDSARLKYLLNHLNASQPITDITPNQIEEYKRHLLTIHKPATVNRHLILFKSIMNLAIKRQLLTHNPFSTVKLLKEDNQRERIITHKEYNHLIANTKGELRNAITIGYYTAMRLNEVCSLTWKQIDLTRRSINLTAKQTKNKTSRIIPIAEPVLNLLKSLKPNLPIFTMKDVSISKAFRREVDKLNMGADLTYHTLRHTAITNMRRAGLDILTIKAISGHKTLTVLDRYNKFSDEDIGEAGRVMAEYIKLKV